MHDATLDDELRAAAFALVDGLRRRYGGRIPHRELMVGVTVRGERVPIRNYQKGIFKPAVVGRDGAAPSVQTSADSPYEDAHDAEAGHFVYKYRGTDAAHPDNVALRRALERQRPLLYLVAVDPGVYDAVFPVYVTGDDPARLQFTLAADQWGVVGAGDRLLTVARREYATRAVMQRLHQQQFRRVRIPSLPVLSTLARVGGIRFVLHRVRRRNPPAQLEGSMCGYDAVLALAPKRCLLSQRMGGARSAGHHLALASEGSLSA